MYCVVPITKKDMNDKFVVPNNINNKFASILSSKRFLVALSIGLIVGYLTISKTVCSTQDVLQKTA